MHLQTVYNKIGGSNSVEFLAEDFTHRVISTKEIAHLYESYDLQKLIDRHMEWITHILGEDRENFYSLRYVNRKFVDERGITDDEFELISCILVDVLADYHFNKEEQQKVTNFLQKNIDVCLHRK